MSVQKSIDQEVLAAVLARRCRGPFSWEQEPGVIVRVSAEGLARRLAKAYAAEFTNPGPAIEGPVEDGDHYAGRSN